MVLVFMYLLFCVFSNKSLIVYQWTWMLHFTEDLFEFCIAVVSLLETNKDKRKLTFDWFLLFLYLQKRSNRFAEQSWAVPLREETRDLKMNTRARKMKKSDFTAEVAAVWPYACLQRWDTLRDVCHSNHLGCINTHVWSSEQLMLILNYCLLVVSGKCHQK